MRWLVFGSYDVRRHPRVGVLIEGLRAAGDEVDEVNVPLPLDTAGRIAVLRQPWRLPVLVGQLARCWVRLIRRSRPYRRAASGTARGVDVLGGPAGAGRGPVDVVLVGYLGHFDVHLARRLFRDTPIVLDHLVSAAATGRDRRLAEGGGIRDRLLRAIDAGALRQADTVLVDTAEQLTGLPTSSRDRAVVVPVGAGAEWFAAGARTARCRWPGATGGTDPVTAASGPEPPTGVRLRVVFVGLFTPLHGARTLGAALAGLAGDDRIEVTMVGTGQDYPDCRRIAADNPRVTWYDWVPSDALPTLVARHHVCLGIFGETEKAGRVVPTKVYQGAAAGCAIVTSDTAPQRTALGDAALFVPAGDAVALGAALRHLAADPDRLAGLRRAARRRAVERFWPAIVVEPIRTRISCPVPLPATPSRPASPGAPLQPASGAASGSALDVPGQAGSVDPPGQVGPLDVPGQAGSVDPPGQVGPLDVSGPAGPVRWS